MFAGSGTADGIWDPSLKGFSRISNFNHGALLMRIGDDGDWVLAGRDKSFVADKSGKLQLAVNDSDASNNKNYFDIKITVEKRE